MTGWRDEAACRPTVHKRAEMFYPLGLEKASKDAAGIEIAKAFCSACPVREACLAEALRLGERWGVWGGLTPDERAILRGPAVPPPPRGPKPKLRNCSNCPKQFEPQPEWPNGRLCPGCRSVHNDPRSRDPQMRRAVAHVR